MTHPTDPERLERDIRALSDAQTRRLEDYHAFEIGLLLDDLSAFCTDEPALAAYLDGVVSEMHAPKTA